MQTDKKQYLYPSSAKQLFRSTRIHLTANFANKQQQQCQLFFARRQSICESTRQFSSNSAGAAVIREFIAAGDHARARSLARAKESRNDLHFTPAPIRRPPRASACMCTHWGCRRTACTNSNFAEAAPCGEWKYTLARTLPHRVICNAKYLYRSGAAGTHINIKFNSIGPELHAGNWRHFIFMAWSAPLFAQVMKLAPKNQHAAENSFPRDFHPTAH